MTDIDDRIRSILTRLKKLDPLFGIAAEQEYLDVSPDSRLISDESRGWTALLLPDQILNSRVNPVDQADGRPWSLLRLWEEGSPCVTAFYRGDDVIVSVYLPGPWELSFFDAEMPKSDGVVPGGSYGALGKLIETD